MTKENLLSQFKSLQDALQRLETAGNLEEMRQPTREALRQAESLRQACETEIDGLTGQILEAQQSKLQFISHITHELRLPLTSIRGYTDLIRQGIAGSLNEQQLNFLNVIKNNVERMTALISELSEINYLETGRLKLNLKPVLLDEQVDQALENLKSRIAEKELTLEKDIPEQTLPVYADPARLVQIISTLAGNACEYTPKGGKISLRALASGDQVRVEVTDTGIGIAPADQEKIFSQFFRSEDEAVREHPGWGLALHLAKRLAEAMGGEMGFQSTLKQGSTFWFSLPTRLPAPKA